MSSTFPFDPALARVAGSLNAGVLLSFLLSNPTPVVSMTDAVTISATGLSHGQLKRCKTQLKALGLATIKCKSFPSCTCYELDVVEIDKALEALGSPLRTHDPVWSKQPAQFGQNGQTDSMLLDELAKLLTARRPSCVHGGQIGTRQNEPVWSKRPEQFGQNDQTDDVDNSPTLVENWPKSVDNHVDNYRFSTNYPAQVGKSGVENFFVEKKAENYLEEKTLNAFLSITTNNSLKNNSNNDPGSRVNDQQKCISSPHQVHISPDYDSIKIRMLKLANLKNIPHFSISPFQALFQDYRHTFNPDQNLFVFNETSTHELFRLCDKVAEYLYQKGEEMSQSRLKLAIERFFGVAIKQVDYFNLQTLSANFSAISMNQYKSKAGAPSKPRFPNEWSASYEAKLEGKELTEYWAYLRSLNLRPVKNKNVTIRWEPAKQIAHEPAH